MPTAFLDSLAIKKKRKKIPLSVVLLLNKFMYFLFIYSANTTREPTKCCSSETTGSSSYLKLISIPDCFIIFF